MYIKKNLRRMIAASMIVGGTAFSPVVEVCDFPIISIVHAEVKMYTGVGEDYASQIESQDVAKLRAREKAIKRATEQAGVYLMSYSRTINAVLKDDEISAITSNTYEIIGDVKYEVNVKQETDEITIIIWKATVNVNVDDSEIKKWIRLNPKDKEDTINRYKQNQILSSKNNSQIEKLRKSTENATTDEERIKLRMQFEDIDEEFLYNQKMVEGNKLNYQRKFHEAINSYTEAIQLKPNDIEAYIQRGHSYINLQGDNQVHNIKNENYYNRAMEDFNKAVQLKPNEARVYYYRGFGYFMLHDYNDSIRDFNKSIELNPNYYKTYLLRSVYYRFELKNNKLALKDLNKAVELAQDNAHPYYSRGSFYYQHLKNYNLAIEDFSKAIKIDPNFVWAYYELGQAYLELKNYNLAIENFNKFIQFDDPQIYLGYCKRGECYRGLKEYDHAIEDFNKAIQLDPAMGFLYYERGKCYKAMGDKVKAKADFAKWKASINY